MTQISKYQWDPGDIVIDPPPEGADSNPNIGIDLASLREVCKAALELASKLSDNDALPDNAKESIDEANDSLTQALAAIEEAEADLADQA